MSGEMNLKKAKIAILLVIICMLFIFGGCAAAKGEGFAIYLTKDDIPPAEMEKLSHADIEDTPVIDIKDIISYNAQTHEIKLTAAAFGRICKLEVPVRGKSFLVCVDKTPVYWGAFWTPISSMFFGGVTIWKPFESQDFKGITLALGYPSSDYYNGEDPRNNVEIMKSLEKDGKLINKLSTKTMGKLPHSMKGYELYSWEEDSKWHFTLITGTNRNKTPEEIVSEENYISESGWVKIHVAGLDAIKEVLSRLPQNESVFWSGGTRLTDPENADSEIRLPPGEIIDAVIDFARQCGLEISVD